MAGIGEAIAGAALSAFFDALFDKLRSSELLNFVTEAQVREEIKEWEKKLRKLRLVLEDAEEKQIENPLVKEWLGDLKHLAYDVEDILDEFSTECLRRRVMGEPQAASTCSKIRQLIPACCSTFTPRAVMFNSAMMSKIGEITSRLEGTVKVMGGFNLVENVAKTSSKVWQRQSSTSLQDEAQVYGRDGDKDRILKFLFKHEGEDARVGVIPIVGMGGMGKTTLANLVYNHNSIPDHFLVKAWVCVSDVFDILRVTKGILESVTFQSSDLKELNQVQLQLKEKLAGKKFLLVLDDVWTENYNDWHALRTPLMNGAPGSKIIVTTRSTNVAEMMGTIAYHDLKRISDDDCWLLFAKHAFENRSIAAKSELENVDREIVKRRCGGLPLAARTLGGLLRSRQRKDEWEEVLNNKLWSVLDASNNIIPVLELSYYYLPSHLKRCFAYCAILPKDYEFEQRKIILLWMAEGLIPQRDENLGNGYFHDLLSRSLFQASNIDKDRFIMHDFVNDLAQKVADDICVRLEDEVNVGEESKRERARHISYMRGVDGIKRFAPFRTMKCLRTFLPLSHRSYYRCYLPKSVPSELLSNLRFLRVLSFSRYNVRELPNSIGDLKHLRYLDLSYTDIEVLPESTTSLYNLQILILEECGRLKKLPTSMDNLINLYYLDIRGAGLIEGMPLDIKELSGLQILSNFDMSRGSFTITTLMNLKSLQGQVCLSKLDYVASASDARKARLKDKKGIHVLELTWSNDSNISVQDEGVQYDVLDELQPHKNLKKLTVSNYAGTRFPSWIEDPLFDNIVHLRLKGCKTCTSLPRLGMLPGLKELIIKGLSSLQRVDQEFYGNSGSNPFPSLEVLRFAQMDDWEEWNACEFGFRALRELFIEECGKLSGKLPIHLPLLKKLVIRNCENFVASISSLPKLYALEINECKEVDFKCYEDFSSLNMVVLSRISNITNMADGFLQRLKKFKKLTVSISFHDDVSTVTGRWVSRQRAFIVISTLECVIEECPLVSKMLDEAEQFQMRPAGSELESLTLRGCEKLLAWKIFLKELTLDACHSLVSFGRSCFPPTLKKLKIRNCENLMGLLEEDLYIYDCDNLTSISSGRQLPSSLQHFSCDRCSNLTSIAERFDDNPSLQTIYIAHCPILKSLPDGLHNLINLCEFTIFDCPCIVSFPQGGLPPASLRKLAIRAMENLEALPDNMHRLSSLQQFEISRCSSLISFPSPGLPSNLTALAVRDLKNCKPLFEWGLDRLNSLQKLTISLVCPEVVSFPPYDPEVMLPPSLTRLDVSDFPNLESLSPRGFQSLTSLQYLHVYSCPNLVSFPKHGLPDSLLELYVNGCPKLASFPENGLPDSLLELYVFDCPVLKQRCQEGQGPESSKIANIPCVAIEEKLDD